MALTKEEKQFIDDIQNKIQTFRIPTTLDECLSIMSGTTVYTIYNDDSMSLVDSNIEIHLIRKSFSYFIGLYGKVDIPGLGSIPMDPYYFQSEIAKELPNYRKIVLDKTRQAGISTIFAIYAFWKAHFFPAEAIDVVSIKQSKAQTFVKKINSTMESLPEWMRTPIKAKNQQKIIFQHPRGATSEIVSESQSDNAGRGDSLSVLIMDEAAFYQSERMVRGIVASAQPTLNKTGGQMIIISCVVGNTYINTENGLEQIIDYKPKNCKLGFNNIPEFKIDGINHQQKSNTFYDSGITPTKKITLQNKTMNEISEIHPYYIIDETSVFPYFKQAKDIKIGDYSLASCREKTFGDKDELVLNSKTNVLSENFNILITENMAYLFGLLIGGGTINFKSLYCVVTTDDIQTQEWLLNNPHFECYRENRGENDAHFRIQGKYLFELLKQAGFTKQIVKNKTFPKRLLQMSRKNTSAMLSGLFDANSHSKTVGGSIEFTSTSKELLLQIKLLLDMFGIMISDERWDTVKDSFLVGQITLSRYFSKLFYEKIGFKIKRKQEKYEMVKDLEFSNSQSYPDIKFWIRDNLIDKNIDKKLSKKLSKGIRKGYDSPRKILRYETDSKTTRHNIKRILDYYDTILNDTEEYKKLLDFYEKDWYLLEVKNIEAGKEHTYDFTIPETKSFYANGAITQNTPNGTSGRGSYYYEQVVNAQTGTEKGTKFLSIDWWEIPDDPRIGGPKKGYNDILEKAIAEGYYYKKRIKDNYKEFFKKIEKDTYQDNEWLNSSYQDLGATTYRQEILHEFIIAGDKVFNEDILDKVQLAIEEPFKKDKFASEQVDGLWFWKDPIPGHRYILGGDIATGTGADYSAIQIIDVGEYEQVAEYKGHISTPSYTRLIKKLARWYNEGFVVIEANSIGEAVFNGLYYDQYDAYSNLFKQKKTKNGVSRYTGWITDVKTRKLIVNEFIDWITVADLWDTVKIKSKRLWLEMSTWVWTSGNKAEHSQGANDDAIMAFSIAMFNRNKAMSSGESFLITNDGKMIDYDSKDIGGISDEKIDEFEIYDTNNYESDDDAFQELYGCSKEEYKWLTN